MKMKGLTKVGERSKKGGEQPARKVLDVGKEKEVWIIQKTLDLMSDTRLQLQT